MDEASVQANVPQLRQRFFAKHSGGPYDARDVKRVQEDDAFLRCFLRSAKAHGEVDKAVELLHLALEWRAKWKMNDCSEADVYPELKSKNAIYYKGVDKEGHKILIFKVKTQKKGHLLEETEKYFAIMLEQQFRTTPEKQIAIIFDFTDAGASNMDTDFSKFLVTATSTYYPNLVARFMMFKMGVALEAIYKIIQTSMEADQKKKTVFVKRSDIQNYINASELEPHMQKEKK